MSFRKKTILSNSAHGEIQTPFFMPDATRGYVKCVSMEDLERIGVGPMVVNTFHLYLEPGMEVIRKAVKVVSPFLKGDTCPPLWRKGGFFTGQRDVNKYELGERVLRLEKSPSNPPLKREGKKISPSFEEGGRGRLNSFMNWPHPLLSDSGGFQIFSLIHKNPKMGKIFDDKVIFKSPIDGSRHELTPEKSIQIQFDLGTDMMVCLDDCPPNDYAQDELENSVRRTIAWAKRCHREYDKQIKKRKLKDDERPLLFSVIQGGAEKDLRKYCADELIKIGFDGYGFGARPVDANGRRLDNILKYTADLIPENALRFALGVGTPEDIVRCVFYGWDMFDCVIPTREGRHGKLFLWNSEFPPFLKGDTCPPLWRKGGFFAGQRDVKKYELGERVLLLEKSPLAPLCKRGEQPPPIPLAPLCKEGKWYNTININNAKFAMDVSPINENSKLTELRSHTKAYLHHLFKMKEPLGARLATLNNLEFYMELMRRIRESS